MKNKQTYNLICFGELAYEFDVTQRSKVEAKIKRRLKYYELGDYNQARVDEIRKFKNELSNEISSYKTSKYYKSLGTGFAELNDFDITGLQKHFSAKYPAIGKDELPAIIYFAIDYFHMR
jgi:hypothetical protein